jgi:hypothetical protein
MRWIFFLIFVCVGALTPHPLESSFVTSRLLPIRAEATESVDNSKEIKLLVSLAWDGPVATEHNLEAFKKFRTTFSNIPVVHFVSPSYFTSTHAEDNKSTIRSMHRPGDQIGIALAPWKSIVTEAGVLFRSSPTFWGNNISGSSCHSDCGGEVPLSIYTSKELKSIFEAALNVMNRHGFSGLKGMQIRGWMATPEIMNVSEQFGIKYDFSMVTPSLLSERLREFPIFAWVKKQWPASDILSQPGIIPSLSQKVIEVPQSLASLDYVSVEQMSNFLDRFVSSETKSLTYHIALNADTVHLTLPKLELVLQNVFKQASEGKYQLSMHQIPEMTWNLNSNMQSISDNLDEKSNALGPIEKLSH